MITLVTELVHLFLTLWLLAIVQYIVIPITLVIGVGTLLLHTRRAASA